MENIKPEDYVTIVQNKAEMDKLTQDFVQVLCGAEIPNIEEKKARFRELHNENRVLQGKPKREYK